MRHYIAMQGTDQHELQTNQHRLPFRKDPRR